MQSTAVGWFCLVDRGGLVLVGPPVDVMSGRPAIRYVCAVLS